MNLDPARVRIHLLVSLLIHYGEIFLRITGGLRTPPRLWSSSLLRTLLFLTILFALWFRKPLISVRNWTCLSVRDLAHIGVWEDIRALFLPLCADSSVWIGSKIELIKIWVWLEVRLVQFRSCVCRVLLSLHHVVQYDCFNTARRVVACVSLFLLGGSHEDALRGVGDAHIIRRYHGCHLSIRCKFFALLSLGCGLALLALTIKGPNFIDQWRMGALFILLLIALRGFQWTSDWRLCYVIQGLSHSTLWSSPNCWV